MPEAASRDNLACPGTAAVIGEKAGLMVLAVERMRDRLFARWEQINDCATNQISRLPASTQELRDEVSCIAGRARYYHQTRPISVLGGVAAVTFVLGILIGLGRH